MRAQRVDIDDIFERAPHLRKLWFQNERMRRNLAQIEGVSLRISITNAGSQLSHHYTNELFRLVEAGVLQPYHVKYLTGLTSAALTMRRRRAGYKPSTSYQYRDGWNGKPRK